MYRLWGAGTFTLRLAALAQRRPIQRAIMAGDSETGMAVMQIQAGLDRVMCCWKNIWPLPMMTAQSLHDSAQLGGSHYRSFGGRNIDACTENDYCVLCPEDFRAKARLDFSRPAKELDAHIRGLSPFPGAWFEANGKRIKVLAAKAVEQQGAVAQLADKGAIVFCSQDALQLVRVQPAGKAAMSGDEWLRGRGLVAGEKLD